MPASVSLVASAESTSDLSVYSFAGTALGEAASNRKLVVAVTAQNIGTTAQLTGVKIGGVACTSIINVRRNTNGTSIVAMFAVEAGSGSALEGITSSTVELTFNEAIRRAAVDVYRLVGASSLYPWQTASALTGTQSGTALIDVPEGGCVIGAFSGALTTAGAGTTWTNLTERSDRHLESTIVSSTACDDFATEQVARSVTASTGNGATTLAILALASWTSRVSVFFRTSGTFTVPAGVTSVRFDTIGSGGNAGRSSGSVPKSSGGGAAAQGATFPATPGEAWNIVVPVGGAAAATTVEAASGAARAMSTDYGRNGVGNSTAAVSGGLATNNSRSGQTTLHYSTTGGNAVSPTTGSSGGLAGAGGAGGPHGDGKNGGGVSSSGSGGGGGTNGGSSTNGMSSTGTNGGTGGVNRRGLGGGTGGPSGFSGSAGTDGGGGGGSGSGGASAGAGSMDWVFTQTSNGEKAGPGSGGGAMARSLTAPASTGAGGGYGGGGGAGSVGTGSTIGPGAPGLVVVSYEPPAPSGNQFILGSPRSTFYKGTLGSSRYVGASYASEWTP